MKNIILGTGNYNNVKSGNTVSVTGDGGNAWGYFGTAYKKLAPRLTTYIPYSEKIEELSKLKNDLINYKIYKEEIENEYIKSYYETRLKNLDVKELLYTLKEKFGHEIILLCHEDINEFCHRRLIADYIELETGIYIPEISINESGKIIRHNPIRYKNKLRQIIK